MDLLSFKVSIQIRAFGRQHNWLGVRAFKEVSQRKEVVVSVDQDIPDVLQEAVVTICQVPRDLSDPRCVRIRSDARDFDTARRQSHRNEYVERDQAATPPHLDRCEVHGPQYFPVRFEEGLPRCLPLPVRRGLDSVFLQAGDFREIT